MSVCRLKRALVTGALFCLCLPLNSPAAQLCPASAIAESVVVKHISDGDSLRLEDGRKLRLIGINAPELARDNHPADALGVDARSTITQLLRQSHNRISLQYGAERQDKYQRTLAHVYLSDGRSLQASLIELGMATAFTTPPNDEHSACYRAVEQIAIQQRRGVWALDDYQLKRVSQLQTSDNGFRRIVGKVSRVQTTADATWIMLDEKLKVRIAKNDRIFFQSSQLQQLQGKTIEIRGWLHSSRPSGQQPPYFMQLRHPDAIHELDSTPPAMK